MAGDGRPEERSGEAAAAREKRIGEILARCSDRINAGETVEMEEVLGKNPDLASELRGDLEILLDIRADIRARQVGAPPAMSHAKAPAQVSDPRNGQDLPPDRPPSVLDGWESALEALRDRTGGESRVLLRDPREEITPVVKPESTEVWRKPGDVDGYQVLGEIARGGIGVILKGRDIDLGRDVALKLLLGSHEQNPQMVKRFVEEAQIGGQLQHPGIVPVYRLGLFPDRRPFFAMKLVKGRTLAALLDERREPSQDRRRFLGIFEQVCQTMAYAHARGVIHRDLKPSNVMVGAFGEVQVMDWGLAKVLADGGVADERRAKRSQVEKTEIHTVRSGTPGSESQDGLILGTPPYMPPEQARGEIEDLDERSDVFGLGAILCEILTGKPPFAASTGEGSAKKARQGDLEDAFARLEICGADAEILSIARACLAPERTDRPRDAGAVAKEVTAYLASVEERARKAELSAAEARVKAAEERKRRRVTVSLAATVVLSLILGGGTWVYLKADRDARLARATREANDALTLASALHERAKAAGLGDFKLWSQAREQAQRAAVLMESGQVDPPLAEKVRQFLSDLALEERNRQFLAALDAAWMAQVETDPKDTYAVTKPKRSIPLFRDAFKALGLQVGEGEAREAAARIGGWPKEVREPAIAAMDRWIDVTTLHKLEEPSLPWLKEVVGGADSDPWRQAVRAAAGEADVERRRAAIGRLAQTMDVTRQPVMEISVLANQLVDTGNEEGAAKLLSRAAREHPGEFWIHEFLGRILEFDLHRPDESIPYLVAALALRPDCPLAYVSLAQGLTESGNHNEAFEICRKALEHFPDLAIVHDELGRCLEKQGKLDEASAEYRRAIEIDQRFPSAHADLGDALRGQGKHEEAMAEYRKAIEIDPEISWVHNGFGLALQRQGKPEEAMAEYRKAIEIDRRYWPAHFNLGLMLRDQGKLGEAAAEFREVTELDPKNSAAHNFLVVALNNAGKQEEADAACRKAFEIDPKNSWAHYSLGLSLHGQGKLEEAITEYRKAIEIDPKNSWAHISLGNALHDQVKLDEAMAEYRKAIEIDPKNSRAHNGLGTVLGNQKKLDEAIAEFRKAIEIDPKDADAHHNLGLALHNQKKLDEAIAEYRMAIVLDPRNSAAHADLGVALYRQEKFDEAIVEYRKAIEIDPRNSLAHSNLGNVLGDQKKLDEAITEFQKAIEIDPKDADAHYNLGLALRGQKKLDEAITEFQKAIEIDPKNLQAHNKLGLALHEQGKLDVAIAEFRIAIEIDPKNWQAHNNLGRVLYDQKKLDDAITEYRKAIEIDPMNWKAHYNLGLALQNQGKLDVAILEVREALELSPALASQDPIGKLFADEAKSLAQKGDFRGAVLRLEKALDLPTTSRRLSQMLESYRRAALPDLVSYRSIDSIIEREVLVPVGAEWRFFRGKKEPSDGLGWTRIDFDDSAWEKGPSGLGYDDDDDATVLSDMRGNYSTVYIRRPIDIEGPVPWKGLTLRVAADDGFVAYLNGEEVGRHAAGAPGTPVPFDGLATKEATAPLAPVETPIEPRMLRSGRNVLAIQGLNFGKDNAGFSLIPVLLGEPIPDLEGDRKRFEASRAQAVGEIGQNLAAYLEGALLERNGKLREAAAKFAEVAGRDRTRPEPFLRLAGCLRAIGDFPAAEERARKGLEAGIRENGGLWDVWFAVSTVDLKRRPEEILASLPKGSGEGDSHRSDLKWALEELRDRRAIRIHCGGDAYLDSKGNPWGSDRFFASGIRHSAQERIGGTQDEPLYQSERWFAADGYHPPGYRVPLPPGRYRVTLHFAEVIFREAGMRQFGVRLENRDVLKDFEPISAGFRTASQKSFDVAVQDGFLDIGFVHVIEIPKISAFEIVRLE